jgi:hypothetical protein
VNGSNKEQIVENSTETIEKQTLEKPTEAI